MPQNLTVILTYAFYLLAGIQMLYWLYFLVGLVRIKTGQSSHNDLGISVVVAAQNEIHNLRALVPRVLKQDHQNFELIVVNDRSEDGTFDFLIDLEKKEDKLRVLHIHDRPEHINGKKYALTLGIKAAKHNNILLTDADCLPVSDQWIATMASGYEASTFVLGFSSYTKLKGFLNYFIRFETLLTGIQYLASAINGRPYMGVGRNLGYKKALFLEKKGFLGFQEVIGGDDDLFVNRYASSTSTEVITGEEALILSTPKTTWKSFLRQKHRHLNVGKHYRLGSKFKIGLFNLSWIFYFLVLPATFLNTDNLVIAGGLAGGRLLVMLAVFFLGTKRFGITFGWLGIVLLDLIYPIYYIFVGTRAALVKTTFWE